MYQIQFHFEDLHLVFPHWSHSSKPHLGRHMDVPKGNVQNNLRYENIKNQIKNDLISKKLKHPLKKNLATPMIESLYYKY